MSRRVETHRNAKSLAIRPIKMALQLYQELLRSDFSQSLYLRGGRELQPNPADAKISHPPAKASRVACQCQFTAQSDATVIGMLIAR